MRDQTAIPKAIVAVVLSYMVAFVSGFIWLGIRLKLEGYADGNPMRITWTWSAVFLREWWVLFVLLIAAWSAYALRAFRIDHGWLSANAAITIGIFITLIVSLWYIVTALDPVAYRPFYIIPSRSG